MKKTTRLKPLILKTVSQGFELQDMAELINKIEKNVLKTMDFWVQSNKDSTDLIIISDKNVEQARYYLQIYSATLAGSSLLAIVLLLFLPILTWRKFLDLKASKLPMVKTPNHSARTK